VALDGCTQAGPETYEELGLFVGRVDREDLRATGVRAFRGERIEIVEPTARTAAGPRWCGWYGTDDCVLDRGTRI